MTKPEPMLWLNDARGIYIPRDFAKSFVDRTRDVSGVSDEDWQTLEAGPDNTQRTTKPLVSPKGRKAMWISPISSR